MFPDEKQKWNRHYGSAIDAYQPAAAKLSEELLEWADQLLPAGQRKVLEAGFRASPKSVALAKGSEFEVHLLDSSPEALDAARYDLQSEGVKAHFEQGDLFSPGNADFDLVFNAGVIEQYDFEDQVRLVRAMAKRSRGFVAVFASNARCYWYWISRIWSASTGAWPFGPEVPVSHLQDVFRAAGVRLIEERYLGREWTAQILRESPGISAGLRELLLQCHSSPLIGEEQSCYLYGAVGTVADVIPPPSPPSPQFAADALRAMASDALSLRVAAETEIANLKSLTPLIAENKILRLERDQARAESSASALECNRLGEQHSLLSEQHNLLSEQHNMLMEHHGLLSSRHDALTTELAAVAAQREALLSELARFREGHVTLAKLRGQLKASKAQELQSKRRAADAERQLSEARAFAKSLQTGIEVYEVSLETALANYRNQRAWRLMIGVRRVYDLWKRHGLAGKMRAIPALIGQPFPRYQAFPDQEIRLPAVRDFVPLEAPQPARDLVAEERETDSLPALPRKYDVVILSIIDFDFRFQRPQQIAVQFARNGHRVFWVSPTRFVPVSSHHPYSLKILREGLWEVHLRGQQPDIYMDSLRPESQAAFEESLGQLYKDFGIAESIAMVQLPFWRRVALSLQREESAVLVYDCMDEWDSFENMGEFNRTEERALVQESDVLLVTAQRLADKFAQRNLSPSLVRNGVDFDFFAASPSKGLLNDLRRPIVGYFGAIADWIDLDLVYEVAKLRPQYTFVLIGQVFGRDVSALESLPNVRLLGNQPYESIPCYLSEFDACTIPFLLNEVTAATDPVKLYEYLSLGKPVVATDMAEIRPYGELIYIAKDVDGFARSLDGAIAETGDGPREKRIEFAKQNTWTSRVAAIDSAAAKAFPMASIIIVTHNSRRYIGRCLDSIRKNGAYPNYEVIVVDNQSSDGTTDILKRYAAEDAHIRCELLDQNTGFAGGNNAGARLAAGDFLILLNPDTIVTPGWLGRMTCHLRLDESIGLLCPTTNFAGNEAKIATAYEDEATMERFSAFLARECRHANTDLLMVPLFCGVMRRSLYLELGGLDEGYGKGMFEDDDLSAAVRARGLRVCVAEDTFVHHFGQGAFSKLSAEEYNRTFEGNRLRFEQKWNVRWQPHQLRAGVTPPHEDFRFDPESF